MLLIIYQSLYLVWKIFAYIFFGSNFVTTAQVSQQDFAGNYFQLMQTPNWFQTTGLATARYTYDFVNSFFRLTNKEYEIISNNLYLRDSINGNIIDTGIDPGTFFVKFNSVPIMGLYRILDFEKHPVHGVYLFVSSILPCTSWLLWKPLSDNLTKRQIIEAYQYGKNKVSLFENIRIKTENLIIIPPNDLEKLIDVQI
jgi:hypothetical protein